MTHRRTTRLLIVLAFGISAAATYAQQPSGAVTGCWTTIDDNTEKPRSTVEVSIVNGTLTGRIVDLHDKSKLEKTCELCPGDRKNQRIGGLEIIQGMKADGDEWDDGTILHSETGKVYDCKPWLEDGQLKVRGYVAFFFRTKAWAMCPGTARFLTPVPGRVDALLEDGS